MLELYWGMDPERIMLVLWAWAQKRITLERLGMGPETYYA